MAALSDGFRAYGAVLSGYTVALVAIQQIDTPNNVFDFGMQRGAAIALGIAAIAIVNDLLVAPDRYLELAAQLAALHRRVRDHAKAVIRGEATDPAATAGLLRETAALRSEISSLVTESSNGPTRKRSRAQHGRGAGGGNPCGARPEGTADRRRPGHPRSHDVGSRRGR